MSSNHTPDADWILSASAALRTDDGTGPYGEYIDISIQEGLISHAIGDISQTTTLNTARDYNLEFWLEGEDARTDGAHTSGIDITFDALTIKSFAQSDIQVGWALYEYTFTPLTDTGVFKFQITHTHTPASVWAHHYKLDQIYTRENPTISLTDKPSTGQRRPFSFKQWHNTDREGILLPEHEVVRDHEHKTTARGDYRTQDRARTDGVRQLRRHERPRRRFRA